MSDQKHTPEPWFAEGGIIRQNGTRFPIPIAQTFSRSDEDFANHEANSARIVACVNACAGISNEDLALMSMYFGKQGRTYYTLVQDMRQAQAKRDQLKAQRDELLLTIKRLSQTFLKDKTAKEITDWLRSECNQVLDKTKEASHEG